MFFTFIGGGSWTQKYEVLELLQTDVNVIMCNLLSCTNRFLLCTFSAWCSCKSTRVVLVFLFCLLYHNTKNLPLWLNLLNRDYINLFFLLLDLQKCNHQKRDTFLLRTYNMKNSTKYSLKMKMKVTSVCNSIGTVFNFSTRQCDPVEKGSLEPLPVCSSLHLKRTRVKFTFSTFLPVVDFLLHLLMEFQAMAPLFLWNLLHLKTMKVSRWRL